MDKTVVNVKTGTVSVKPMSKKDIEQQDAMIKMSSTGDMRVADLKKNLTDTDYKFNVDYPKQKTPDWDALKISRQEWRDEIVKIEKEKNKNV